MKKVSQYQLMNKSEFSTLQPQVEAVLNAKLSVPPRVPERDLAISGGELHLQPYEVLADLATPEQYWAFFLEHVKTLEEVAMLTDHRKNGFLRFVQSTSLPSTAPKILELGEGGVSYSEQAVDADGKIKVVNLTPDLEDAREKLLLILPEGTASSVMKEFPDDWPDYKKITVCLEPVGSTCAQRFTFVEGKFQ